MVGMGLQMNSKSPQLLPFFATMSTYWTGYQFRYDLMSRPSRLKNIQPSESSAEVGFWHFKHKNCKRDQESY
jgi:hypothetical protein